jgi:penicillin-insensitive murein endopeptidase
VTGARRSSALLAAVATAALSVLASCAMPSALVPGYRGSVGLPHAGFLDGGKELPKEGPGFRWRSAADFHYGVPRLVEALADAAGDVAKQRPTGVPIYVGEISAKTGGRLPKHHSHRTGRDVDVLFFATTLDGAPLANTEFVKFGADGIGVDTSGRFVRFDVEREWLFLKALLQNDKIHLSWIFISRPLEALLIEHAIARGEPAELVAKAERVLSEPGDSLPHDDHTHIRVACELEERARGCIDNGPQWAWLPRARPVEAPASEIVDAITRPIAPVPTVASPVAALP